MTNPLSSSSPPQHALYGAIHGVDGDSSPRRDSSPQGLLLGKPIITKPVASVVDDEESFPMKKPLLSNGSTRSDDDDPQQPAAASPVAAADATILSEVANISKNLIGGGVLSLSGGMALFANSPAAAVSALWWVVLLGAVFGYFCFLIGKCCKMSKSYTYRQCWENTVGDRGSVLVAIANMLDPLLGIFANASIMSQSLQLLLAGIDVQLTVTECLLWVSVVGILPLCLMKTLNALAPFSAIGMAAVLTALAAMMVRLLDGSYQPGGMYYEDIPAAHQPKFGAVNRPWSTAALPFVCMVYTSFDMHYNSPRFYAELRDATVPRFGLTVTAAFGVTAAIYYAIAVVGFLTFGEHCDSYILNNYSPKDPLATIGRCTIGLCALVSYPLNFIGIREDCLDLLGATDKVNASAAKRNAFTVVLLTVLTVTECFVTDLGLINSVGGGTTVTLVAFLFPAFMFKDAVAKYGTKTVTEQYEVWFVMILMVVGIIVGIIGVWDSIAEAVS